MVEFKEYCNGRAVSALLALALLLCAVHSEASRTFNGSSQYLETTTLPVTDAPFSVSAWVYSNNNAAAQTVFALTDSGNLVWYFVVYFRGDLSDNIEVDISGSGGAPISASTSTTMSINAWHHVCFAASTSSATVYLDGGGSGSTGAMRTMSSLAYFDIGALRYLPLGGPVNFWSGSIAEVGLYSIEIAAADCASLAAGMSPRMVRPEALIRYWPLFGRTSPEVEPRNGGELTVTGATTGDHPRIIRPVGPFERRWITAAAAHGRAWGEWEW